MLTAYKEIRMENKEIYKSITLDVITFASEDVIVTSNIPGGNNEWVQEPAKT